MAGHCGLHRCGQRGVITPEFRLDGNAIRGGPFSVGGSVVGPRIALPSGASGDAWWITREIHQLKADPGPPSTAS